jgi:hypothetical protein
MRKIFAFISALLTGAVVLAVANSTTIMTNMTNMTATAGNVSGYN